MSGTSVAVQVRDLHKAYGGAAALQGFSMEVRRGEIRALLGQNGCGKSTFVKAIAGILQLDAGEILLHGQPAGDQRGWAAQSAISVIHQDAGVADSMTVFENIEVAGRRALLGRRDDGAARGACSALMKALAIELPLDAMAASLTQAEKALLAIVRAMRHAPSRLERQILLLDEPTAALSRPEADRLLALMRRLAASGCAVIFISHRLAEVMAVCDSATVMRAGRDVQHLQIGQTSREELVSLMLGSRMDDFYPAPAGLKPDRETRLRVEALSGRVLRGADFELAAGEVVGVTGLAGMGQEELPALIFGATRPSAGRYFVDGREARFRGPRDAMRAQVALVPRDRLRDGVWPAGSAEENATLPVLRRHCGVAGLRRASLAAAARRLMLAHGCVPVRPELGLQAFSGGNQQKIVFAKWLQLAPRLLLLDEPTQGVDPAAAALLLRQMHEAARLGSAVLIFSGDQEQLAAVCHRVLVVHDGRIVARLAGAELTEAALLQASQGLLADAQEGP